MAGKLGYRKPGTRGSASWDAATALVQPLLTYVPEFKPIYTPMRIGPVTRGVGPIAAASVPAGTATSGPLTTARIWLSVGIGTSGGLTLGTMVCSALLR